MSAQDLRLRRDERYECTGFGNMEHNAKMFVPDRVVFFCFVFISPFLFFCSTYQYSVACSSEQLRPIRLERQGVDDLVPTRHGSERNAPWSGAVMSTDSIIQTLDNKNINGTWRWQIESVQRSAVQGHSNHHVELHEYCSEQTYAALQRIVAFFFFFSKQQQGRRGGVRRCSAWLNG